MAKRKFFYDNLDDSIARLGQSVVLCKGEPVWVNSVQGLNTDQMAEVTYLPYAKTNRTEVVPLTKEYFEVHDLPKLGYVDYRSSSYYLSRRPLRSTKQGMDRRNVYIPASAQEATPEFGTLVGRKEFVQMLKNKYESFEKIFDFVVHADEAVSKAFSRVFALSMDDMESVNLWNRGIKVAIANNPRKTGPLFTLPKKFRYLAEELQELGIKAE